MRSMLTSRAVMSLRQLSRSQLIDEILVITLISTVRDRDVRLFAGMAAIALVVSHHRDLIRATVAATVSVVEDHCDG